jgi:Flp pilus assembly protein TadG
MSNRLWRHATGRWRQDSGRLQPTSTDFSERPPVTGRPAARGQALVELALVVPILFFLSLAAIDLGRVFYSLITVTNAARAGAMEAAYHPDSWSSGTPCADTNRVMCAATRESTNSFVTVTAADVSMTCSTACTKGASPANRVTVTVAGQFSLITPLLAPFIGGQTITLRSASTADIVNVPIPAGLPTPPSQAPSQGPSQAPSQAPSQTPSQAPSQTACPAPIVGFWTSQQNKNRPVDFGSTSSPTTGPCAIAFYRWAFGDGSTDAGSASSTSHQYAAQGTTYDVTLTVTYPRGTVSLTTAVTTR